MLFNILAFTAGLLNDLIHLNYSWIIILFSTVVLHLNYGWTVILMYLKYGWITLLFNILAFSAGLLSFDPRVRERKKFGQKGARAKYTWLVFLYNYLCMYHYIVCTCTIVLCMHVLLYFVYIYYYFITCMCTFMLRVHVIYIIYAYTSILHAHVPLYYLCLCYFIMNTYTII